MSFFQDGLIKLEQKLFNFFLGIRPWQSFQTTFCSYDSNLLVAYKKSRKSIIVHYKMFYNIENNIGPDRKCNIVNDCPDLILFWPCRLGVGALIIEELSWGAWHYWCNSTRDMSKSKISCVDFIFEWLFIDEFARMIIR